MRNRLFSSVLLVLLLGIPAMSQAVPPPDKTKSMPFEKCLKKKDRLIARMDLVDPHEDIFPIVDRNDLSITQVCTADDVVQITCIKETQQMIVKHVPHSTATRCPE